MKISDDRNTFQAQLGAFGAETRVKEAKEEPGSEAQYFYTYIATDVFQGINVWESVPNYILPDFKDFLQGGGYAHQKEIMGRVAYLNTYDTSYKGIKLGECIGHGAEAMVYRCGSFVVKHLTEAASVNGQHMIRGINHAESVDNGMRCGMLVAGDPDFEQLFAASYHTSRKVYEYIGGVSSMYDTEDAHDQGIAYVQGVAHDKVHAIQEKMVRLGLSIGDLGYSKNIIYRGGNVDDSVVIDLALRGAMARWVRA